MGEALTLGLAWAAGVGLGAIFFGGLWWTVRKGVSARRPALWFSGSLLLRMGIALTGFYFVSGREPDRLLLCLLGFGMASLVVARLTRAPEERPTHPGTGVRPCASVPTR